MDNNNQKVPLQHPTQDQLFALQLAQFPTWGLCFCGEPDDPQENISYSITFGDIDNNSNYFIPFYGGYPFAEMVQRFLYSCPEEWQHQINFDPEGSMFCMYGTNWPVLELFLRQLVAMLSDEVKSMALLKQLGCNVSQLPLKKWRDRQTGDPLYCKEYIDEQYY